MKQKGANNLKYILIPSSINPTNNNIDLSLRGKDVNDRDPAPPPPKRKITEDTIPAPEGEEEEASSPKKRKIVDATEEGLLVFIMSRFSFIENPLSFKYRKWSVSMQANITLFNTNDLW